MSEEIKNWLNGKDYILIYRLNPQTNGVNEDLKNYVKQLQQENEHNKYVLTEFEKWLEKKIQENAIAQPMTIENLPKYDFLKECQYGLSKEYYIFTKCLNKLQELKEGNNEKSIINF